MDLNLLSKIVGDLILGRDEVGLPGVGTFVAEIVPASFSDKGYTLNPPYRRLSFRQGQSSDTSLVEAYAKANSLDFKTAENVLQKFLADQFASLEESGFIEFPGLGKMRQTRQGTLFFVGAADLNIFPDGFGLEPVSLRNRSAEQPQEIPLPVTDSSATDKNASEKVPAESSQTGKRRFVKRKHGWLVALVVIVLLCAILLAAFMYLAQADPDFVNRLLYSPEELQILGL